MGTRTPKTIGDFTRWKLDVGVRCRSCGRLAVFDASEMMQHFIQKKWTMQVPIDASRFRCACRSRDVETIAVHIDHRPKPLPPRKPVLTPIYVKVKQ